jgi:hypothetical protein
MDPKGDRRLAAILFADIEGYSRLMHENEQEAMDIITQFRTITNNAVEECHGELIQDLGDGCLLVFGSAINALDCAIMMQTSFAKIPKLMVRIGIDHGDIIQKESNVFGDSINIASRIESIAPSGAILFSQGIYDLTRNQSQFKTAAIGDFEFKNIEDPITVYALANEGFFVPKKQELSGKLKSVQKEEGLSVNRTQRRLLLWMIPLVLLGSLFIFQKDSKSQGDANAELWLGQWEHEREIANEALKTGMLTFSSSSPNFVGLAKLYYGQTSLTDTLYDIMISENGQVLQGRWKSELKAKFGRFRFELDENQQVFNGYYVEEDQTDQFTWNGKR